MADNLILKGVAVNNPSLETDEKQTIYVEQGSYSTRGIVSVKENGGITVTDGEVNLDEQIPADIASLDSRVTTAEGEIDTLQSEMNSVEDDILALENEDIAINVKLDTAVLTTTQTLTDGEKLQARTNIDALSTAIVDYKLDKVETGDINQVYGVNESNEQVMVEVETAPVSASTKLVTSGGVATALSSYALKANVLTKGSLIPFSPFTSYDPATKKYVDDSVNKAIIYKGLWDSTGQTDYSSLNSFRRIKAGWRWEVIGTGATIDGVEYKEGDFITFNQEVSVFTTILTSMIDKTDNTDLVTSINGQIGDVVLDSGDIAYDNVISGLTATKVKTAIDEVVGLIGDVETLLGGI